MSEFMNFKKEDIEGDFDFDSERYLLSVIKELREENRRASGDNKIMKDALLEISDCGSEDACNDFAKEALSKIKG